METAMSTAGGEVGTKKGNTGLWVLQAVLAALFLFAGLMKLVSPIAELSAQAKLPGGLLRFIGVAETLGALGLILPGIFRVRRVLTPMAAVGLTIIMAGATVITLYQGGGVLAGIPLVTGILCAIVARKRYSMSL